MYRFDGSTVIVIKTDLTYTVTLQTFCTLLSGNRRDAAVSQPLLRQPPAEAERVGRRVSIELAIRAVEPTRKTSSAGTESRRSLRPPEVGSGHLSWPRPAVESAQRAQGLRSTPSGGQMFGIGLRAREP